MPRAVSYTHLDVYKRQISTPLVFEGQFREDRYSGTGNDWSGRLSAIYTPDKMCIRDSHIAILARADKDAQTLAREAASELPQNPVTALPMLDLSRDQDAQSLARLSVQATARQRHLLDTGLRPSDRKVQ